MDWLYVILLMISYLPVALLVNRLQLLAFPARRNLPAQGSFTRSAILTLVLLLLAACFLAGNSPEEKFYWLIYLGIILGSASLVMVSVMCVSESGRRFFLMHLIRESEGLRKEDLPKAYSREHMLDIRINRLVTWGVLHVSSGTYRLVRKSAYFYSLVFYLWGRLLGNRWL